MPRSLPAKAVATFATCASIAVAQAPALWSFERLIPPAQVAATLPREFHGCYDVDGDGDLDLPTTYGATSTLRGGGDGRFGFGPAPGPTLYSVVPTDFATSVAFVDLNGDGALDLLSAAGPFGAAATAGSGSGQFAAIATTTILGAPGVFVRAVAAGDVDGDGDADVLVAGTGGGARLWLNQGGFAFTDGSLAWGIGPTALASVSFADLDGDGALDLVGVGAAGSATAPTAGALLARRNLGGAFGPTVALCAASNLPLRNYGAPADALADLDGDGRLDVVWTAAAGAVEVRTQPSAFAFALAATVAVPVAEAPAQSAALRGAEVASFVVASRASATAYRLVGGALLPLGATPANSVALYRGDVDGDGDDDAIVSERVRWSSNNFAVAAPRVLFRRNDGGLVPEAATPVAPSEASVVSAADTDGDGATDLLGATRVDAQWAPFSARGRGDGTFDPAVVHPCVGCPAYPAYGLVGVATEAYDADSDGDADLLLRAPGQWTLLRNDGPAGFVSVWSDATATMAYDLGDVDADGLADLVVQPVPPVYTGPMLLRRGIPGGGFDAGTTLDTLPPVNAVALRDLDLDGDLDLLYADLGTYVRWNSAGVFGPAAPLVDSAAYTYDAADFDADGDVDLLVGATLFRRIGPASFAAPESLSPLVALVSATATGPRFADFDGDGDTDVVANNGALIAVGGVLTTFRAAAIVGDRTVFADLDLDGDADLVGPGPLVQANLTRELVVLSPARVGGFLSTAIFGAPSAPFLLAGGGAGYGPAATPFGALRLDPATAALLAFGVLPDGVPAVAGASVPNDPAFVGVAVTLQAAIAEAGGVRLTNARTLTFDAF
jgi:hypothetical protein